MLTMEQVLQGTLKETLYDWPEHRQDGSAPLQVRRESLLEENTASYMSDKLGLHKISNPDPYCPAVSLHRKSWNVILSQLQLTKPSVHTPLGRKEGVPCL